MKIQIDAECSRCSTRYADEVVLSEQPKLEAPKEKSTSVSSRSVFSVLASPVHAARWLFGRTTKASEDAVVAPSVEQVQGIAAAVLVEQPKAIESVEKDVSEDVVDAPIENSVAEALAEEHFVFDDVLPFFDVEEQVLIEEMVAPQAAPIENVDVPAVEVRHRKKHTAHKPWGNVVLTPPMSVCLQGTGYPKR